LKDTLTNLQRLSVALTFGLAVFVLISCKLGDGPMDTKGQAKARLSVEGSSTMVLLIKAWVEHFHTLNPNVSISVITDDSGGGIAALLNGTTDLAAASRDLTTAENRLKEMHGVRLKKYTVARDSIAIVVNADNPIRDLTLEQLEGIYAGGIENWRQLDWKDMPIDAISRESSSGTYNYFQQHVLHGKDTIQSVRIASSSGQILDLVASNPGAIAYVGLGHALAAGAKVKILPLKLTARSLPVQPSTYSTTNDYPLSRPLLILANERAQPAANEFVRFCLSDAGQKLVPATGYVSIR
jgi:phosphate transport system substrate-binding protein